LAAVKNRSDEGPPRLFVRAKSAIGPDGGGFGYDIDVGETPEGADATRIKWGEEVDGTAKELLDDAEKEEKGSKLRFAKELIKGWLEQGETSVDEIKRLAYATAALSERTSGGQQRRWRS
jgi:putative DNA primase/helicase